MRVLLNVPPSCSVYKHCTSESSHLQGHTLGTTHWALHTGHRRGHTVPPRGRAKVTVLPAVAHETAWTPYNVDTVARKMTTEVIPGKPGTAQGCGRT